MVISCPNCSTRYRIDDASIGDKGRMVRCASCKHRWFVDPPQVERPTVMPDADVMPTMAPATPSAVAGVAAPPRAPVNAWWLASVLVLLLLAALIVARDRVVALAPASASIYAAVGLPAAATLDLNVQNVASRQEEVDGKPVLLVTGEVQNTGGGAREVPDLHVALLDEKGQELRKETFRLEQTRLEAGEKRAFEHRLDEVPEAARSFSVTLDGG